MIFPFEMNELPATFVEGFHDLEAVKKMKYQSLGRTGLTVSKLSFGKASFISFVTFIIMNFKPE